MTRIPRPLLLLLLVLGLGLAPVSPAAAGSSAGPAASHTVRAAAHTVVTPARPGGKRAEHRTDRTLVTAAAATATAQSPAAAAAPDRPRAPRLLLVQRPRPPTSTYAGTDVSAPTGRSPPSPAGT